MRRNKRLFHEKTQAIQEAEWYRQRFDACPHFMFFLGDAHTSNIQRTAYPFGQGIAFAGFSHNRADWYHSLDELTRTAESIIEVSRSNPDIGKVMVQDFLPWQERFYEVCLDLREKDLSGLSDEELIDTYNNLAQAYTDKLNSSPLIDGFALTTDRMIASRIRSFLEKKGLGEKYIEYFSVLTAPTFLSFLQQEEIALLRLGNGSIEKHQQDWFWMRNNYTKDHVISVDEFRKRQEENLHVDVHRRVQEVEHSVHRHKEEKDALIEAIGLPEDIRTLLAITDEFNAWQDERKKGTFWATHYFSMLLEEFSRRTAYTMDQLKYALPPEMIEILDAQIDPQELEKRISHCMIVWVPGEYDVTTDMRRIQGLHTVRSGGSLETKELTGFTASRGVATGRVKIIESAEEADRIEEGDVLVAVMTRPDYIAAMQKAVAFVTDEGGITCHAAIVAREMKKPCIIGTKVGTKVLRDGDLVEVDAEHGRVRVIQE